MNTNSITHIYETTFIITFHKKTGFLWPLQKPFYFIYHNSLSNIYLWLWRHNKFLLQIAGFIQNSHPKVHFTRFNLNTTWKWSAIINLGPILIFTEYRNWMHYVTQCNLRQFVSADCSQRFTRAVGLKGYSRALQSTSSPAVNTDSLFTMQLSEKITDRLYW